MGKDLLSYDPAAQIATYHHYDDSTKITSIERVQNIEPILERNKALANTEHEKKGIKNSWWHAGIIPLTVIEEWLKEGVDAFSEDPWHRKKVKQKLNSPDYRYLRTGRGKL